jgi:signal transduction histidine kinase
LFAYLQSGFPRQDGPSEPLDSSPRSAARPALKTASQLQALFGAFPDLFLQVDGDGNVLDCNGGGPKDPLLAPQTFSGRRLHDVLSAEAVRRLMAAFGSVRRNNTVELVEFSAEVYRAQLAYECRVLPLYWDRVILVLRNITDRKTTEEKVEQYAQELAQKNKELETALKMAREATQLKSRFLANMSHEIRTPMNGVLGMTEFLLGTEGGLEQREYAESIKQSADALLTLINDILDLSKIEAGKMRLDRVPFHFGVTIQEIAMQFAVRASAKGLKLSAASRTLDREDGSETTNRQPRGTTVPVRYSRRRQFAHAPQRRQPCDAKPPGCAVTVDGGAGHYDASPTNLPKVTVPRPAARALRRAGKIPFGTY